jgi:hypothetical protein
MNRTFLQKLTLWLISLVLVFGQYLQFIPTQVRAFDSTDGENSAIGGDYESDLNNEDATELENEVPVDDSAYDMTIDYNAPPVSVINFQTIIDQYSYQNTAAITFGDIFNSGDITNGAKILLPKRDLDAIRATKCLADALPDYTTNPEAVFADLRFEDQQNINTEVSNEKLKADARYTTVSEYLNYLQMGLPEESATILEPNKAKYAEYLASAKANGFSEENMRKTWLNATSNIAQNQGTKIDSATIACVTSLETTEIEGKMQTDEGRTYLSGLISSAITKNTIDVRIIKTLVYLVTPKDQGGAGHWRVKVNRILQPTGPSKESDSIYETLNSNENIQSGCADDMTAADCGRTQADATNSTADSNGTLTPNAVVQDQNSDTEYDAWMQDLKKGEDAALAEKNISAHYSGQAIDISELDDIRCTLVKRVRIGKDKKEKQAIKPIKLAWQTTDGFNQSGGAADLTDTMSLLKSTASDTVLDLLSSLDGGVGTYEGDFSNASLDDMMGVLGKSLLGSILNSPSNNLDGFDAKSTLANLGGMYFADYLGVPREAFLDQDYSSLKDIKYLIGRNIIEKKLNLPIGSLDDEDVAADGTTTHLLTTLLENVGRTKIEYEMKLKNGDLKGVGKDGTFTSVVGVKVIEKELNLQKNSWPLVATSFNDLSLGAFGIRSQLFKQNPGYIDNLLHLASGTTAKFVSGQMNSSDFSLAVGQRRLNDTSAGFKYLSMNDTAYQLPEGTWQAAISADKTAYMTIGRWTLARVLGGTGYQLEAESTLLRSQIPANVLSAKLVLTGDDSGNQNTTTEYNPANLNQFVFRQWLSGNTAKTYADSIKNDILDKTKTVPDESAKNVTIDSLRNDLYPMSQSVGYRMEYEELNPGVTQIQYDSVVKLNPNSANSLKTIKYFPDINTAPKTKQFQIPKTAIESMGISPINLQMMLGYGSSNTRAVFEGIGSKVLYHGLADKLLTPDERKKLEIDELLNGGSNSTIDFYLTRVDKIGGLITQIQADWETVKIDDYKGLGDKVTSLSNNVPKASDIKSGNILTQARNTFAAIRLIGNDSFELKSGLGVLREYHSLNSGEKSAKVKQTDVLINDVNELNRTISEISTGKAIPTAESINKTTLNTVTTTTNQASGSQTTTAGKSPSKSATTKLFFALLSGQETPVNIFLTFGAAQAEEKLDLPANSLLYLVKNYENFSIKGVEALLAAVGQAKLEAEFNLPYGYFQGERNIEIPDFTDPAILKKWLPANEPKYSWARKATDNQFASTYASYIKKPGKNGQATAAEMQADAKNNYYADYNKTNGMNKESGEKSVENIYDNTKQNNLTDGIRTPEADLLFRLGIPSKYASEISNSTPAKKATSTVDSKLGLKDGMTKDFLSGNTVFSTSVGNNEKKQIEASDLKLNSETIDKYTQILNGELPITTAAAGDTGGEALQLGAQYVESNPYAVVPTRDTGFCVDSYVPDAKNIVVNNGGIQNNSFCIYDINGRHCFESQAEANRFTETYKDDQFANRQVDGKIVDGVLGAVAVQITSSYNLGGGNPLNFEDTYRGLINFATSKATRSIFTGQNLTAITTNRTGAIPQGTNQEKILATQALERIASLTKAPATPLISIFTREDAASTLFYYKKAIGDKATKAVIGTKLFESLGLDIDPSLFDSGDFYSLLSGDFSSLSRIGTSYLDKTLELQPGTAMSIFNASDNASMNCALAQAGGTILGNLIGLNYLPIENLSTSSIGQAKVEEAIGLPRGSFVGDSSNDIVNKVGAIKFTSAFKIPVLNGIPEEMAKNILGKEAEGLKGSSTSKVLSTIQDFLSSKTYLPSSVIQASYVLDDYLVANYAKVSSSMSGSIAGLSSLVPTTGRASWSNDSRLFTSNLQSLDAMLSLPGGTVYKFLVNKAGITPKELVKLVGSSLITSLIADTVGEAIGINPALIVEIKRVFVCSQKHPMNSNVCLDAQFGNADYMTSQVIQFVGRKIDNLAGFPEGTSTIIMNDPSQAFPTLMGVGAAKLDQMLFPEDPNRSDKIASMSGLFRTLGIIDTANESSCHNNSAQLASLQKDLDDANAAGDTTRANQISADINTLTKAENDCVKIARDTKNDENLRNNGARDCAYEETGFERDICKAGTKTLGSEIVGWAQQAAGEYMAEYITNRNIDMGEGIKISLSPILDPIQAALLRGDIASFFQGDLRYYSTIATTMAVNAITIDVDNPRASGCSPKYLKDNPTATTCLIKVGATLILDMFDIHNSTFGSPTSDQKAADASTYTFAVNDGAVAAANPDASNNLDDSNNATNARYAVDAETGNDARIAARNDNVDPNTPKDYGNGTNSAKEYEESLQQDVDQSCALNPDSSGCVDGKVKLDQLHQAQEDGVKQSRDDYQKTFKYKSLDAALWALDINVPAGFSEMLIAGNVQDKLNAFKKLLADGLTNGNIFGIPLTGAVADIAKAYNTIMNLKEDAIDIYNKLDSLIKMVGNPNMDTLNNFIGTGGFKVLNDLVSKGINKLIGFDLPPDITSSIIGGFVTGNWGFGSCKGMSCFDTSSSIDGVNGMKIPTLAGALSSWASNMLTTPGAPGNPLNKVFNKVFGWADKAFGLPPGSSQQIFNAGVKSFNSWQAYKANPSADTKSKFEDAKGAMVLVLVTILIQKFFGDEISSVETALGLVPGSLLPVVSLAVYNFAIAPLFGLGPMGWTMVLVMFLLTNLFGVYKVEIFCTADGYFPLIDKPKQAYYNSRDTGFGQWGGRVDDKNFNKRMQAKYIESAQYKARVLIGNALSVQENSRFAGETPESDVIPRQILTGRAEDVDYWKAAVDRGICKPIFGENNMVFSDGRAICDGDSRDGLWQNKQTVAWTHIGF